MYIFGNHERVTRRRASGKEDGDCGEKDFPRGSEGVTTLVVRRGRRGRGDSTSSAFLISSQPPNPQVRCHHRCSWKDLFIIHWAALVPSLWRHFRLIHHCHHCHHHSGIPQVMILYWPLHWTPFCSQLHHCSAPLPPASACFSPHNCSLHVHCTQLHPSKLAGFACSKICPFLWNHEVKWTESLCMLCVEPNVWRACIACRYWQICASRSWWLLCKSSN